MLATFASTCCKCHRCIWGCKPKVLLSTIPSASVSWPILVDVHSLLQCQDLNLNGRFTGMLRSRSVRTSVVFLLQAIASTSIWSIFVSIVYPLFHVVHTYFISTISITKSLHAFTRKAHLRFSFSSKCPLDPPLTISFFINAKCLACIPLSVSFSVVSNFQHEWSRIVNIRPKHTPKLFQKACGLVHWWRNTRCIVLLCRVQMALVAQTHAKYGCSCSTNNAFFPTFCFKVRGGGS